MILLKSKLKIIIVLISAVLILGGGYYLVSSFSSNGYEIVKAEIGEVKKEIVETGTVKRGEMAELGFKEGGRIAQSPLSAGDKVFSGQVLARLDDSGFRRDLEESLAGLTAAETALDNAVKDLDDILKKGNVSLNGKYEEMLSLLGKIRADARNIFDVAEEMRAEYFFRGGIYPSSEALNARNEILFVYEKLNGVISKLTIKDTGSIDNAVPGIIADIKTISALMGTMIEVSEHQSFKDAVSASDSEKMRAAQSTANSRHSELVSIHQEVKNLKTSNYAGKNSAEGKVESAKAELGKAKAKVSVNELKVGESALRSPADGTIADVLKRAGETVASGEAVVLFLPDNSLKIEVDIYEGDVSRIAVGDEANVELVSFPEKVFEGRVASINPTESIINDIVYYKVSIKAEGLPEETKPGMTADVKIITDKKEGAVILPSGAIKKDSGGSFVMAMDGGKILRKNVETGLAGDNRMIEILSGVNVGEDIIINYP